MLGLYHYTSDPLLDRRSRVASCDREGCPDKNFVDSAVLVSDNLPLVDAYLQTGLDALGDGTRMAIFQRLANGPMAVNELAGMLPVSRPAVSQHLRVLKDAGLVTDAKAGTRRMYQLDPEGVARLRAHFDRVWEKALGTFQSSAESMTVSPIRSEAGSPKRGEKYGKDGRRASRSKKHSRSRAH
jgi:DNA-binding transcriptional ArsR family regulator